MKTKLIVVLALLAGCATTSTSTAPCPTAREVMSEKGRVIDCWHDQYEDTKEYIDRCWVVYPGEKRAVVRGVFKRHCGL